MKTGLKSRPKLYLAAVAFCLAVLAACGGTIMLLTDVTAAATNVMTAGKVDVTLWENNTAGGATADDKDVADDISKGIQSYDLGIITPNMEVPKKPWIENTGTTGAYVFVELIFWTESTPSDVDSRTSALAEEFLNGLNIDSNWQKTTNLKAGATTDNSIVLSVDGDDKVHVGYFYVDSSNKLNKLSENSVTDPVFTNITIPTDWGDNIDGLTFKLQVKGYAIQSDNVALLSGDKYTFFRDTFGTPLNWLEQ